MASVEIAAAPDLEYDDGELVEDEWRDFVARSMEDELADSRQDIYTIEDGLPYDVPGLWRFRFRSVRSKP